MVDDVKKTEEVKLPSKEELLNAGKQEETKEPTSSEPKYTEVEKVALSQGWKPKDQWDGNPDEHRSAREYLDRGELLGKIKVQNEQLREIRTALQGMSDHNRRVYAAGYENALKELKVQKLQALKEGEAEQVLAIDDKIDSTKEALQAIKTEAEQAKVTAKQQGPSPITQNWLAINKWYQTDAIMRHAANGLAMELGKANPNVTEEEIYQTIDREMRKEFPHKFKTAQAAPSPDGESTRSAGSGKTTTTGNSFEKLLGSMSEMQATIARNLVKTGAITKEKYVEDWNSMNGGA